MTTMMLASMMTGAKIGDEPSSPNSVTANDCCATTDDSCAALPCPGSSFLPKTMSEGDLSAISIENDNSCSGRRDAGERDNSSSTLGDVDADDEGGAKQLVAVNFDKADIDFGSVDDGGIRKSTSMVSFHSSRLNQSAPPAPLRSSLAGSNKSGIRGVSSTVSFGSVSIREHERVVDDQPALPGPALGLGWAYNQKDDVHLDEYVKDKKKEGQSEDGNDGEEATSKDGDEDGKRATTEKKYVKQHLSSFARSVKLRSYGFEHNELKTEAREALAEGKRMAEMARRKKEQKKLSYKVKKALRYFVTSES